MGRATFIRYDSKVKKQNYKNQKFEYSNWNNFIFISATFITLYFNSKIQDPFNAPKMWVLLISSFWIIGYFISKISLIKDFFKHQGTSFTLAVAIFIFFGFVSAIQTDVKITAFLGENQRRDGFLTYLSLMVFLIAVGAFWRNGSEKILFRYVNICGWLLASYGLMQMSGIDFVQWNNPGGAVISTLGNSNFAGSMMAICAILSFGQIFLIDRSVISRIFSLVLTIFLLFIIFPTNARQGLLAFGLGIVIILTILLYNKKIIYGKLLGFSAAIVGIFSIFGMLQIGPLTSILYKPSVSVRGHYWYAGIEMFKSNPLFGVGFDRYGAYFKEFRDVNYPLSYGFDLTSTNAHNVFIQLFATAGFLVGFSYLVLNILILVKSFKLIKGSNKSRRILAVTILAAWIAFQAQSVISIDNIGITIWGWVLGGAILGMSTINSRDQQQLKSEKVDSRSGAVALQPMISTFFLALALLIVVPMYKGESNMFQQRMRFNPQDANLKSTYFDYANKTIKTPLVEPYYKIVTGNYLISNGFINEGFAVLSQVYESDPRNLDNLSSLAGYYESQNLVDSAIDIRLEITKYDPWNAKNYLLLGRLYKYKGNQDEMIEMLEKIKSFASGDPIFQLASTELVS
jgi:O-antigen ligase